MKHLETPKTTLTLAIESEDGWEEEVPFRIYETGIAIEDSLGNVLVSLPWSTVKALADRPELEDEW